MKIHRNRASKGPGHCIRWLYPTLSICFVPIHLFVVNWGELAWREVWPVLLVLATVATTAQGLLVFFSAPPWLRLGLSFAWLAFFLYAPIHRFLGLRHIVLMAVLFPFSLLVLWLLTNAKHSTTESLEGPFTLGVTTVLLINLGIFWHQSSDVPEVAPGILPKLEFTAPEVSRLPDIYLIVFDAFAGGEALEQTFNYDNAKFVHQMEKKGFEYFERSRSLYDLTICSIPAVISARRICHELLTGEWNASFFYLKNRSAEDSPILKMMRQAGYKFVSIASDPLVSFENLDADQRHYPRRKYFHLVFNHTPLAFLESMWLVLGTRDVRAREWYPSSILWALDQIEAEAASKTSPKFVFAHIMLPHMPFYFDAEGRVQRRYLEQPWEIDHQPLEDMKQAYLDQVAFLQKRIMRLADKFEPGANGLDPIVLLQGDHGPRWPERGFGYTGYENRSEAWAVSQFSALNMVRAPSTVTSRLTAESSPINSFIAVVNSIFSSNIEELPDISYVMINENRAAPMCIGEITRTFAQESGPFREVCE